MHSAHAFRFHKSLLLALACSLPTVAWGLAGSPAPATSQTVTEDPAAEDAGPASADDEDAAPPQVIKEQLLVTATGIETPARRIGSAVTVITADDLARQQRRLVVDALSEVPGVDVRRNGPPGSVTSIFIRGADSDHALVLLDGVPLNDPASPNRLPFLDHLTVDGVERIEVLRGPQSTLYGSDAIGGVVQIITKKGAEGERKARLWAEGGSYSTVGGGVEASGGLPGFGYSVAASLRETDGFSASSAGVERDGGRNGSLSTRLDWDFSDYAGLDLTLRHTDAAIDFDGFLAEEGQRIDARQTAFRLQPHLRLLDGRWEQSLTLLAARHERDTSGSFPSLIKGRTTGVHWRNDLRLAPGQVVTLGVENEWERAEFPDFEDDARTLGLYVQDQFEVGDSFSGTLGARVDRHSEFGSETTYRVTAAREFARAGTVLRASLGTGFKAPSLSELSPSAFGGNPDLEPETSRGFDAGVEQTVVADRFTLGVTYFRNEIRNLIIAVFDPATALFLNLNVDEADTSGVEASFRLRPAAALTVRGSYTYTDSEAKGQPAGFGLEEGSSLLRRPKHKGAIDADWRSPRDRVGVTLSLLYVGTRADIDPATFVRTEADAYTRVDAAASYKLTPALKLFGRIENLFDEDYEDVLGFNTAGFSAYGGVSVAM